MSKDGTVRIEDGQIPTLIAERDRYQQWLEQLESGRDEIPEHIYERIAADYAARLEKAVELLRTHVGELEGRLAERRKALAAAVDKVAACKDKLVEARVRYRVGEYDERRWASIEKELTAAVEAAERQRAALEAEVRRLEGALSDVRQPAITAEDVGDTPFLKALAAAGASSEPGSRNGGAPSRNGASRDGAARDGEASRGRARKPTELRTLRCDTCGSFNLPEAMFCEACGDDLPAPAR